MCVCVCVCVCINVKVQGLILILSSHVLPGKKQSGGLSRISLACSPKVVRTNEIARLVILIFT